MDNGTVLYVEDDEPQRMALKKSLEMRGFTVYVAGDIETARSQIKRLRHELDVIALDMRLEDAAHPELTGADVALEFFDRQTPWKPEFLIHSQYSEIDYFKLAMQLSAVYLHKSEARQDEVIRHIRALAIRRALSVEGPQAMDRIRSIVEKSNSPEEAVSMFCRDVLAETFRTRLGAPFALFLTYNNKTQCCAGDVLRHCFVENDLPSESEHYETLQAMIFAEVRHHEPFMLDMDRIGQPSSSAEKNVLRTLDGAAFLPLSINRNIRLSLGILRADSKKSTLAEPPMEMAQVLGQYFQSDMIELLMKVLTDWAKIKAERDHIRLTTAQVIYHAIGAEQISILEDMASQNSSLSTDPSFKELYNLASDLAATGNLLDLLERKEPEREIETVSMAGFVSAIWSDLEMGQIRFEVEGDCVVCAGKEDLLIIVMRVLQWLAQRADSTPEEFEPQIKVRCAEEQGGAMLIFEDRSRRLATALRARLFEPFAETVTGTPTKDKKERAGLYLPLYLAKTLVEVKYRGWFGDCSDEMTEWTADDGEPVGHRLVMRFPRQ